MAVLATLSPDDEIFRKDYVAPPVRKRLQDVETIVLPNEIFEGLPASKSKAKARRLKIVSEAFAQEKATRLKEIRRHIDQEIIDQEVRVDELKQRKRAKQMPAPTGSRGNEEEKKGNENLNSSNLNTHRQGTSTPRKGVNPFMTPGTSANSSKQGHSAASNKYQLSPNSQMQDLTQSLLGANLETTLNPQSQAPQGTKKK